MKRWLPLTCVIAALAVASAASADQRGLNLSWDECGAAGVANKVFACNTNSGINTIVASFLAPDSITTYVSNEGQIDLIFATSSPPNWWQLKTQTGQPAACRNGGISVDGNFLAYSVCANAWLAVPSGGLGSFTIDPFGTQANRVRIATVLAVGIADAQPLTPGTEYYAFKCTITHAKTVGTGACAGCTDPVCLVLNRIHVIQPTGTDGGSPNIFDPPAGGNRAITWQGGTGVDCNLVPTRNKTWGQIKSLYR